MQTPPPGRPVRPSRQAPSPPDAPAVQNGSILTSLTLSDQHSLTDTQDSPTADFHTPLTESPSVDFPPSVPPKDAAKHPQDTPQDDPNVSVELTSLRAHYLKKQLVQLQFRGELTALTTIPRNNISTFSYLGPPFTPPPKDGPRLDLPFLRFMFKKFVLSFPFLASAPKNFFPDKLQPFMASLLSRNLSPASPLDNRPENSEEATRLKLLTKLEKNFAVLVTSGTKLKEPEDVVRLTQKDLDRLEAIAKKRAAREKKLKNLFEINVVCVRTVVEKKRVRSKMHEVYFLNMLCLMS